MINQASFLVVDCDGCECRAEDDEGVVLYFGSIKEIFKHLGGIWEGQIFPPSPAAGGGVLLAEGRYYCYNCKLAPHRFIIGYLIDMICARCDRLADEHDGPVVLPHGDVIGQAALLSDLPYRRPAALDTRADPCHNLCSKGWRFPESDMPEPPDGARLEFVHDTDRYAAWRDIASSLEAGWPAEASWCLFGDTVPHTWPCMQRNFGPGLHRATRLIPAGEAPKEHR